LTARGSFRKYLECGIFAHGFARAWCDDCGHDYFVAYSCKGRGVCPSCNTRRMVETAAHLTDHVFPRLPVRQWVLSVPKRLRYFMQRDGAVLNMVLRIFLRVIAQSLQDHSPGAAQVDKAALHIGAVAFIHRFGSSLSYWLCRRHIFMVNLPHGQEIQGSLGVRGLLLRSILRLVRLNGLSVRETHKNETY
jgi:hypothetical protein